MTKFQVWVHDSTLIGHLEGYTRTEAEEYKLEYARKVWDQDLENEDVSLCEIPENYYDELIACTAF